MYVQIIAEKGWFTIRMISLVLFQCKNTRVIHGPSNTSIAADKSR